LDWIGFVRSPVPLSPDGSSADPHPCVIVHLSPYGRSSTLSFIVPPVADVRPILFCVIRFKCIQVCIGDLTKTLAFKLIVSDLSHCTMKDKRTPLSRLLFVSKESRERLRIGRLSNVALPCLHIDDPIQTAHASPPRPLSKRCALSRGHPVVLLWCCCESCCGDALRRLHESRGGVPSDPLSGTLLAPP
jgi:hypothetical protein